MADFTKWINEPMVPIEEFIDRLEENNFFQETFGLRRIPSDESEILYKKKVRGMIKNRMLERRRQRIQLRQALALIQQEFSTVDEFRSRLKELKKTSKDNLTDNELNYLKINESMWDRGHDLVQRVIALTKDFNPVFATHKQHFTHKNYEENFTLDPRDFPADEDIFISLHYLPPEAHSLSMSCTTPTRPVTYKMRCDLQPNEQDPPICYKRHKKQRMLRFFSKRNSVFRDFKDDTPAMLD